MQEGEWAIHISPDTIRGERNSMDSGTDVRLTWGRWQGRWGHRRRTVRDQPWRRDVDGEWVRNDLVERSPSQNHQSDHRSIDRLIDRSRVYGLTIYWWYIEVSLLLDVAFFEMPVLLPLNKTGSCRIQDLNHQTVVSICRVTRRWYNCVTFKKNLLTVTINSPR